MRFLVDAQLPPRLAQSLTGLGHAASHVINVGLRDANDNPIWDHALAINASIITKDEDFATRIQLDPTDPPIIWLRIGNCTNRQLTQWLVPLLNDIVDRIETGEN